MKTGLILVIGLLAVILLHNLQDLLPRPALTGLKPDYDHIDYYLSDFQLSATTPTGSISHTVKGYYLGHWRERQTSFIVEPTIQSQQANDQIELKAEEATLQHNNQQVHLNGQVRLQVNSPEPHKAFNLSTSFLQYDLMQHTLTTDQAITFKGDNWFLQGSGLEGKLDEAYLRLNKNVRATYQTAQP